MRVVFLIAASLAVLYSVPMNAQTVPTRSIVNIGQDLYRARNNRHHSVFLVTDAGIVLVDPISRDFSTWLKAELAARFGVPVKYVVYSHHHPDHASGGAVFRETAEYVGHENMIRGLALEPADDVVSPTVVYKDRMTITLGGMDVELIYTGALTHTDDMSIIRFPGARTIMVVDFLSPRQIPGWPVGRDLLDAWLNAIRLTEALDYDVVAGGHGPLGTRTDLTAVRRYLEELRDEVVAGIDQGLSVSELQGTILMPSYQSWDRYADFHQRNVEGMHHMVGTN